MGDQPEYNDDDQTPQWVKDLRKEVKELKRENESLRPLKQQNLLLKAGVDLDAPQTELFLSGWKGDWDNADEVAAALNKYGLQKVTTQEASEQEVPDADEHQRIENASLDGEGLPPANQQPDWFSAKSPQELMAMAQAAGVETADQYD